MKYFESFTEIDFISFYLVLFAAFGLICVQKHLFSKTTKNNDISEYLLMGRRVSLPLFVATLVSTWYGGILGVTQIAFDRGIYNFITQGFFYYVSAAIFAVFLVKKARKTEAKTFPEMITKMYGRKSGRVAAFILLFTSLPVGSAIAMGIYMLGIFPESNLSVSIVIGVALVGLYCSYGGMKSIVILDSIQFILMYVSILAVVIFSYIKFGGYNYLSANLPEYYFYPVSNQAVSIFILWLILAVTNTFLSPIFYQRCFAAKSESVARNGILISIVFWFVCDICTTLGGMYAKAHFFDASAAEGYLMYSLFVLPSGFKGLFFAAILITIVSALDSSLFTASTTLMYDLARDKNKHFSYFNKIGSMFWIILVTAFMAIQFEGRIEQAWLTLNSITLSLVLVPILFGFAKYNFITDRSCSRVIKLNILLSLGWILLGFDESLNVFYFGFSLSLILFLLIYKKEKSIL